MADLRPLPRWSLAALSLTIAAILAWCASMLPWHEWTLFAVVTTVVALLHLGTGVLALLGHDARGPAWRWSSTGAIAYLAYLTWNLVTSAVYVAVLYGSLGEGVAAGLAGGWAIAAFVTLPVAVWGIAATGGIRRGRTNKAGATAAAVFVPFGLWNAADRPLADEALDAQWDRARVGQVVASVLPEPARLAPTPAGTPSLSTPQPAVCAEPPGPAVTTVVYTYLATDEIGNVGPVQRCSQGPGLTEVLRVVSEQIRSDGHAGAIKIDVIEATQPLRELIPIADSLLLRPGLDGVCEAERCLMPWQLVAFDQFRSVMPIPVVPDLKFGITPGKLRMALQWPDRPPRTSNALEGLTRIETISLLADAEGRLHRLRRMKEDDPPLSAETLSGALRRAEGYIVDAVGDDGRFLYTVNPFTGVADHRGFSLARQAGTSLVLCELAEDRPRARAAAIEALEMLATTERRSGELGMLAYPADEPVERVGLGNTALSTIAFLSCRDLVGDRFDPIIARMTAFLLKMQKPEGGFFPEFDLTTEAPVPGPDPLYAVGQGVYALTLLEALVADGSRPQMAAPAEVHDAVERSMRYTAGAYWDNFLTDFFYMEENWHCLAARASLGHHRNDAYERFCIDYVRYKVRMQFDDDSGVADDLLGGWGFSNVLPTHNTGTAGLGEALAAAMTLREARGEVDPANDEHMRGVIRFLMHQQLDETNCFACTTERNMVGGMTEHYGSPTIRIDFVQHAWAAMGHGGRALGLVPNPAA
jgi:hypothetical protein